MLSDAGGGDGGCQYDVHGKELHPMGFGLSLLFSFCLLFLSFFLFFKAVYFFVSPPPTADDICKGGHQ